MCKTNQSQPPLGDSLGEPLVDNQAGDGFRVLDPDGTTAGWSRDCSARTVVDCLYRTTANAWKALPAGGARPADMATTTTLDGRTVDFVVRRERGTINRFLYSYAMLAPGARPPTRRCGTAAGLRLRRRRGDRPQPGHARRLLDGPRSCSGSGYAIAHSSGTRTSVHYNLQLGGETALMTKERFVERYGVPRYTVGVGGSGGAIQQYVYGQNHPRPARRGDPRRSPTRT